jgi:L-fuconolactonase
MMQPIIDTHQHFWTLTRNDYGWLKPDITALYRDYQPADLAPILKENGIVGTVLIQAAPTVAETEYLLQLAEQTPYVQGVIGWVDLSTKKSSQIIKKLAKNPYFMGVRPMLQDLPDPDWIDHAPTEFAMEALIDHGLTLELLVQAPQRNAALRVANRYPELNLVIDHFAKPSFNDQDFALWQDQMLAFAAIPNVWAKMSGLFESANTLPSFEACAPYFDHLLKTFTPQRVMWGSNWPVMTLHGCYADWLNLSKQALHDYSAQDQQDVFYNNAIACYQLSGDTL